MKFDILKIMELQFDTLPVAIQEYIINNEWEKVVANLASNFRLHKDQRESVEAVVLYTIVGLADSEDFTQSIMDEAKIEASIANEIAKGVNLNIFQEVALITEAVEKEQARRLANDDSLLILDDARASENSLSAEEQEVIAEYEKENKEKVDGSFSKEEQAIIAESERKNTEIDPTTLKQLDPNNKEDVAAEALLREIENHKEDLPQTTNKKADTHLQNHVDSLIVGEKTPEKPFAEKVPEQTKPQEVPASAPTRRPATHMRTLKSDIVKEKMGNPSWSLDLGKNIDEDVKKITKEALEHAESSKKGDSPKDPYKEPVK